VNTEKAFKFPDWWPNPPVEKLPTILDFEGSNEFDAAMATFNGEEPEKRVRLGVYYEDDYCWFEVARG